MAARFHPEFFRKPWGPFTPVVLRAAGAHAASVTPDEACGLVLDGVYVPCVNQSPDPRSAFRIDQADIVEAYANGTLQAVIHSHPGGPWYPSREDMAGQIATGVPWAIVIPGETSAELACWWGGDRPPVMTDDGLHVPRAFLHGVSDCYTLCQDYYRQFHDVRLMDFARAWEWWRDADAHGSLYLDNLQDQGFSVVSTDAEAFGAIARPGDAYLLAIRSKVPNHAGIYLGDGLLLEHMHGNLSHREPIARKLKHITHWLRHTG
jgi:proteasome lid subunit RPN8/RPN11